ncbi:MAG: hypothetical protein EBU90_16630 [Proteobacteria bacterium]|nr:hypothetical protein [Pseudomonadota bacterium]
MRKNLFGEIIYEAKDFSELVVKELHEQNFITVTPKKSTNKGFITNSDVTIPKSGLYVIYKFQQPIYVGYSTHSIRDRIGRFIAAVRGTEHEMESHPAGYKYKHVYGDCLDQISFKASHIDFYTSLPNYLSINDVEKELIYTLRPVFNMEIYKSLFVAEATYTAK